MTSMTAIQHDASTNRTTAGRRKQLSATVANFAGRHASRLRGRTPVVIMRRKTLFARENNAFMLGADFGAHTGESSEVFRRPRLEVVS